MDGYPAGAICLSDCDTAWHGAVPWAISKLTHRYGWVHGSPGFWNLLGLIPVGVATALLIWTLITGIAHAPNAVRLGLVPSVLITDGPYRFTRNPMYVAELASWLAWALFFGSLAVFLAMPAAAAWQPTKPIEFIATAGPGGGTDNLARTVQSIIVKYKLTVRLCGVCGG